MKMAANHFFRVFFETIGAKFPRKRSAPVAGEYTQDSENSSEIVFSGFFFCRNAFSMNAVCRKRRSIRTSKKNDF
jgi:hypothetical protein